MSRYYSGKGDDGYTGLLGEDRVPKHHPLPDTYGLLDEASAALGLARAFCSSSEAVEVLRQAQRDLYHIMAELAAGPQGEPRFQLLEPARVDWLEDQIGRLGQRVEMPKGFVLGGDSRAGACLDLARTVVRRAERALSRIAHEGGLGRPHLLAYLNRLSSLCFILALHENQLAGVDRPSMAKGGEG
ncbi:MAG TPA: cob(I)yrinic acid a,c-diamide adenosyltransferase [Anaerolineales bacterium]